MADVAALGLSAAAATHGVPISTLFDWRKAARQARRTAAPRVVSRRPGAPPAASKSRPAKSYTPSQRAQILESAAQDGVSAAAVEHGCSRFTIYDWRMKVARAAAGAGVAPTSGPDLGAVEAQRDHEILDEWHRHPGLGPSQIRNQLRAKCVKVAVHTVQRVMQDAGYRPPKVERRPHDQRFEAVRPNHLWHLDFVKRRINQATTFTLILIDDHSRYVVGHGVDEV